MGVGGFGYLGGEDVAAAEHVAGEEDVFFVGREAGIRFGAVVLMGHVDEVLGFEDAGLEEVWAVECAVGAPIILGRKSSIHWPSGVSFSTNR